MLNMLTYSTSLPLPVAKLSTLKSNPVLRTTLYLAPLILIYTVYWHHDDCESNAKRIDGNVVWIDKGIDSIGDKLLQMQQ